MPRLLVGDLGCSRALLLQPLKGGPASWLSDYLLEMNRHDYLEETYFVASYSPIPDGTGVGGVLVICHETTEKIVSERRLRTLRELAVQLGQENGVDEICRVAAQILNRNARDVSFALLYLLEDNGETARLKASAGTDPYVGPANPHTINLAHPSANDSPLADAAKTGQSVTIDDLDRRFGSLPGGIWPGSARSAVLIPLGSSASFDLCGFLIAGVSLRRRLDHRYGAFLELAADQIARALRKARSLEQQRRETESLARADRAKDEFLAMLGHELRNPLSPILTSLNLMHMRGDNTFRRERDIIERQVHHVVNLVDDLLDVSRITRGKIQLKFEPLEMLTVVLKAIEMASPIIEQRMHHLTAEVAKAGLPLTADPMRLSQVICNLLTNAAKYTESGGNIWIRAGREHDRIVLRVRDNGIGIAPAMLPRVFDLFSQGARSLDRAQGGLGIGLTIVKSLVELHGGSVHAYSDGVGKGSEFVIRLPLAKKTVAAANASISTPAEAADRSGPRAKILIVDDNRDAAEILGEALGESGYEIQVAFDAPSTLATVSAFLPDVMLIDIGLPVMDGYELARRLRAKPELASARLIAVTGYGQESDRRRALEAGFDEHVVKPIDLDRLHAMLREHLSPENPRASK